MNTVRTLFVLASAAIVGFVGYEIGVSQSIAAQVPAGAPAPYGYYSPFFHIGFGFFSLLFPLLFFLVLFGLLRAVFGGGRGMWHDGRSRLEEWHREAHERSGGTDGRAT